MSGVNMDAELKADIALLLGMRESFTNPAKISGLHRARCNAIDRTIEGVSNMIKFFATSEGRPMIGLGLSRGNCEKLLAGKPIFIDLKVMLIDVQDQPNLNEATVLLFAGETEETMQADLSAMFTLLKPKTHREEN